MPNKVGLRQFWSTTYQKSTTMFAPLKMLVSYPLYIAMERAVFSSRTFEKTWSSLRPHLEKGVEVVAAEVHPQGRSLVRKYVFDEPAIRRIVNDCLREMMSTDILSVVVQVQRIQRDISRRRADIVEWEKDLITAPQRSWNPLDFSQGKLKEKIRQAKNKNQADLTRIDELSESALTELKARGVDIDRRQLDALLCTADGEDVASILAVADTIAQAFMRMEEQLKNPTPGAELSKTYAGYYMMCCRLYLEAIERAIHRIQKVYLTRVANIRREATKQINKAEAHLSATTLKPANRDVLKNNIDINYQIIKIADFYATHLQNRTKELTTLQASALENYEVSVNTFLTLKLGAELADCMRNSEADLRKIFEFTPPKLSVLYDAGFGEQFRAVTEQIAARS